MAIEREGNHKPTEFHKNDFTRNWIDTFTDILGDPYFIQQPDEVSNGMQQIAVYYLPPDIRATGEGSSETILTVVHNPNSEGTFYKVDVCKVGPHQRPTIIQELEIVKVSAQWEDEGISFYCDKTDEPVLTVYSSGIIEHIPQQ